MKKNEKIYTTIINILALTEEITTRNRTECGYGFVNEYPAGRYLRDAIGCIPSCGTSEIQKMIIAGETLKKF